MTCPKSENSGYKGINKNRGFLSTSSQGNKVDKVHKVQQEAR